MSFEVSHYIFLLVYLPFLAVGIGILLFLKKKRLGWVELRFAIIALLLFAGRLLLIVFGLGQFPNLAYDPIFYSIIFIAGLGVMMFYVREIENMHIRQLGKWKEQPIRQIIVSIVVTVLLLLSSVLILFIAINYRVNTHPEITVGKFFTALFFGLGAIYEEWFFRGVMLQYKQWGALKQIIISSLTFFAIHIGYLPFIAYGSYYLIMLIFSFALGTTAKFQGILASTIVHFLYVFISILAI